jgi:hypothetical protein
MVAKVSNPVPGISTLLRRRDGADRSFGLEVPDVRLRRGTDDGRSERQLSMRTVCN